MGFQGRWSCLRPPAIASLSSKKKGQKRSTQCLLIWISPFLWQCYFETRWTHCIRRRRLPPPSPTVSPAVRSTPALDGWTHPGEEIAFLFPRNNKAPAPARFFLLICTSQGRKMADLEAVLADVSYLMAMEKSKSTPAARASKKIILPEPR